MRAQWKEYGIFTDHEPGVVIERVVFRTKKRRCRCRECPTCKRLLERARERRARRRGRG